MKDNDDFPIRSDNKKRRNECNDCTKRIANTVNALKRKHPKPELCECCGKRKKLLLDHCHETGNFRGWICYACNTGIGKLGDDIDGLLVALQYLRGQNGEKVQGEETDVG